MAACPRCGDGYIVQERAKCGTCGVELPTPDMEVAPRRIGK